MQQIPEAVQKWNVKALQIQRNKRHQDISVMNDFWADLDNFLKKEKVMVQVPDSRDPAKTQLKDILEMYKQKGY